MTTLQKLALAALLATGLASAAAAEETKLGFIYVGPAADFGYNTSMDLGRKYVESKVPGVTTTAFEGVPETAEVARVMERLINSGNKIIFATSYGYLDEAIKLGEKYPNVRSFMPAAPRPPRMSEPIGRIPMTACISPA